MMANLQASKDKLASHVSSGFVMSIQSFGTALVHASTNTVVPRGGIPVTPEPMDALYSDKLSREYSVKAIFALQLYGSTLGMTFEVYTRLLADKTETRDCMSGN